MNSLVALSKHLESLGYSDDRLLQDYSFADVLSDAADTRRIALAAFTQTPPSYRTAAFGVVDRRSEDVDLSEYRALGAPVLFALSDDKVEVWRVRGEGPVQHYATKSADELPELFARLSEYWNPQAIHRAKAIESDPLRGTQLDFVDLGLMIAIEGEVHEKLDALLKTTLAEVVDARGRPTMDARLLFQATFRFLAAKILSDRGHESADGWFDGDVGSVLQGIDRYYGLGSLRYAGHEKEQLAEVWQGISSGINFRNISADDLAFVYENTFVTTEVRAELGTHSTPRQMAEHIVRGLDLSRKAGHLRVYEPFTGAGVLLIAALRQLREALPLEWSDRDRHEFLTQRLSGDEKDEFACEVAKLSLILADYPNHNGWDIQQADLFQGSRLQDRISSDTFVICNPPFEDFAVNERTSHVARHDVSKPVAVLQEVLLAQPAGVGFVLPSSFRIERRYRHVRAQLERQFRHIEIVEIPDDVFSASRAAATLLIARQPWTEGEERKVHLRSSEVTLKDRLPFLNAGVITRSRSKTRWVPEEPEGDLWVPALHDLWEYLAERPQLSSVLELHRGLEWRSGQSGAWRQHEAEGYRLGLHSIAGHAQYLSPRPVFVDVRPENMRTGAHNLPWSAPKLILNGARLSRYQWKLAASLDTDGLVCSQQFIGAWPKNAADEPRLLTLMALLNGPIANAFASSFSSEGRFRVRTLGRIPLPRRWPKGLDEIVSGYLKQLDARKERLLSDDIDLSEALTEIDARLIESYELPVRLERELLLFFEGARRPAAHHWSDWADLDANPGLSLAEIRRGAQSRASGNWVSEVFRPLPEAEADLLRKYLV